MDRLLYLIQDIENDSNIESSHYISILLPSVMEIQTLAEDFLIDEDGKCNWENIKILEKNKIFAFPIEWDSNGWLVGGLSTKKGIIVYG
jgi:hypothetical protein